MRSLRMGYTLVEDTVPIVPARYNDQSDLVRDVTASTTLDFDLKSKP